MIVIQVGRVEGDSQRGLSACSARHVPSDTTTLPYQVMQSTLVSACKRNAPRMSFDKPNDFSSTDRLHDVLWVSEKTRLRPVNLSSPPQMNRLDDELLEPCHAHKKIMPERSRTDVPIYATSRDRELTKDILDMNLAKYEVVNHNIPRLQQAIGRLREEIGVLRKALPSTTTQGKCAFDGSGILYVNTNLLNTTLMSNGSGAVYYDRRNLLPR